jgi:tellurium resistance protein TerD
MDKGQEVSLTDIDAGLHNVFVGLGWETPEGHAGHPFDVDAAAFLLNTNGRVRRDTDFVFYNNLETEGGVVRHLGDNTSGKTGAEGEAEDAEVIEVNLDNIAFDVEKVSFSVSIHNATERQQNFSLVRSAYIRIVNKDTGQELARFDLTEDAGTDTAMVFGELVRDGVRWLFRALGQGNAGGLYKIARDFGVNVAPN